jgi:hypothetical protein
MRPAILRYYRATKRLEKCAQELSELRKKEQNLLNYTIDYKITSAIALISEVESELRQRTGVLVSNVHPKLRRHYDVASDWQLLVKDCDYDLEKYGIKAADQWFLLEVNRTLLEFTKNNKIASISDMTRFKLIAAVSEAGGPGKVEPTAIKQFFVESSRQRKHL